MARLRCHPGAEMGSQCSRPSLGSPARGLVMHLASADREPRERETPPPLVSSSSSPCEQSDCDSIGSGTLSNSESCASNVVSPLESPPPWMLSESCFSASLFHAPNRMGRSFETTSGQSSQKGRRTRSRLLTHSLPDRINAEDARWHVARKLSTTITSAALGESQLKSAVSRRRHPQGHYSTQSDNCVSVVNPPSPDPQTKLDEPTRRMFLEFYHRNRKEQRR